MCALVNVGIAPPVEFPQGLYEEIIQVVTTKCSGHASYEHFNGAWSAIAYRYGGMVAAGDSFTASIKAHGDAPPPDERFIQETALFGFFSNGFSVFEAYAYGLFAIGNYLDAASFPLANPRDQQAVSPSATRKAFEKSKLSPGLVASFDSLFASQEYEELKAVRNILSHRTAPGRIIYASTAGGIEQAAEWKIQGIKLDAGMTDARRTSIAKLLEKILGAAASFIKSTIK